MYVCGAPDLHSRWPRDVAGGMEHYDLIVVGAGAGGLGAAGIARTFGLRTLIIEAEARNVGGDCLNYGCVPSKALIHVARLAHAAREAGAYGLEVSGEVDFARALRHVHAAQDRIREHENADWLAEQDHQDVVIGWARFTGERTLAVDGREFRGERIVLATGSRPRRLDVPGAEDVEHLHTNHTFFERERPLPGRLLVVGAGPIGCEMAQAMRRLGSAVTLVDHGDRLLDKELPRYSRMVEETFRAEGVDVRHQTEVAAFSGPTTAVLGREGADDEELAFDECLVAIGRDQSVREMNLELAGIATDEHGVLEVDERYRTTNPHVFAVGDAMGRENFSHAAEMHNRDLIVNMLSPIDKRHSLERFSWVTYTSPEVATFGLTAKQLDDREIDFETIDQPFADDDRAIAEGYADDAYLTLYVAPSALPGRGAKILGGSMIAPQAGELIQEWVLALQSGATLNDVFDKIYAYPVASRINQKAAFTYRQGGLGEGVRGAIRWWWRRSFGDFNIL